jgi:hypothetical protein
VAVRCSNSPRMAVVARWVGGVQAKVRKAAVVDVPAACEGLTDQRMGFVAGARVAGMDAGGSGQVVGASELGTLVDATPPPLR